MSILDLFRLEGKTALVTGVRRGLGKAMAIALAEAGADIVGTSAALEGASDVGREIEAIGRRFRAIPATFPTGSQLYAAGRNGEARLPSDRYPGQQRGYRAEGSGGRIS